MTEKHAEIFINKLFEIIARKNSVKLVLNRNDEIKTIG